nr:hypothetical protein [Hyphomonas sp. Mor2]
MQTRALIFALSATLLGAQNGAAQATDEKEPRFFADIGYSKLGRDIVGGHDVYSLPEYGAINGHVGYRFSEHWSVEGEAMVGVQDDHDASSGFFHENPIRGQSTYSLDNLVGFIFEVIFP